ncbi:MAG: TatD family hydrolase [Puniceicoccales bacterium]|jgi:TatD DNase family protein|nr:TatD family hydrolase [Puniceicoccales bacterium]
MKLIDSHCHLDDFYNDGELEKVLTRASEANVKHFVAIGTSPQDFEINFSLAKNFSNIDYTVGVHPLFHGESVPNFETYLTANKTPVAIGEIGLDYHSLLADSRDEIVAAQKSLFVAQLSAAKKCGLPVALHSREAFADTLALVAESGISGDKILFHCYGYGVEEMRAINELGAYVSFSGTITYKNAHVLREALRIANKDRLLIETDCPYLAPVPHRGEVNEPSFLVHTARFIEEFFSNDCAGILDKIFDNTVQFFHLKIQ